VYDQAPIGNDLPLDIELVERIEIIRGPSQSVYGSNAFFAVINVITKHGRALDGMELSGEAGSFNTYKGRLSYGRKFGDGIEALLSGSFQDSKGQNLYFKEFDTPDQNNGWANNSDGERYGDAFLKLRYKDLTLEGAYGRRTKNIPTASFGAVFNSTLNKSIDAHTFLDLKYAHQIDSQFGVMARISYNNYKYDGNYLYSGTPSNVLNIDYSRGSSFSTELQLTKELFHYHNLLVSVELRDNFQQHQGNYDNWTSNVHLDDSRDSMSWGLSVQDEYTVLENLVLHAGIRYDHFSTFGDTFNPRVALVYTPCHGVTRPLNLSTAGPSERPMPTKCIMMTKRLRLATPISKRNTSQVTN
jgi:outer membrane receptor for ferrienterochelin and colicins